MTEVMYNGGIGGCAVAIDPTHMCARERAMTCCDGVNTSQSAYRFDLKSRVQWYT